MATEPSVPFAEAANVEWKQEVGVNSTESVNLKHEGYRLSAQYTVDGEDKEASDTVNSDVDAEGEEVDDEYTETYVGNIRPAEAPISEAAPDTKPNAVPSTLLDSDASSIEEDDTSNADSSSDAESQWAAESDVVEDAELEASEGNHCM